MTELALSIAASGAHFQQEKLEQHADDLAQQGRPGHRGTFLIGASNAYVMERRPGTVNATNGSLLPAGLQKGTGIRAQAIVQNMSPGKLIPTDNPYHLAIQGNGYFQIELPNGDLAYTMDGTFTLNQDRTLVTQQGYVVSPAITLPANVETYTVNGNGDVLVKVAGNIVPQNIGTIEIATFPNEEGLERTKDNLLLETPSSNAPILGIAGEDGRGRLLQGHIRGSNVDPVKSVIGLIEVQHAFKGNMDAISAAKQMNAHIPQAA